MAAVVGSSPVRFALSSELWTSHQTAWSFTDFSSSSLRSTDGARPRWILRNPRLRIAIPHFPLSAANPRSRKEWIVLHNLPHSVDKHLNGKEKEEEEEVGDPVDPVESLETEIELTSKIGRKSRGRGLERLVEFLINSSDAKIKTGDNYEESDGQRVTLAWPRDGPSGKNRPLDPQIQSGTDGTLEDRKIREKNGGQATGRRRKVSSSEKGYARTKLWKEDAPSEETNLPRGAHVLEGSDGDSEAGQLLGNQRKEGSSSAETTESGTRVEESDGISLATRELRRSVAPMKRYGNHGHSESVQYTERENMDGVAPQNRRTPDKFNESIEWRGLRKKQTGDPEGNRHSQNFTIFHPDEDLQIQNPAKIENLRKEQSNQEILVKGIDRSASSNVTEDSSSRGGVGFKGLTPPNLSHNVGASDSGNIGLDNSTSKQFREGNAGITKESRRQRESSQDGTEKLRSQGRTSLYTRGGDSKTGKVQEECWNQSEEVPGLIPTKRETVDYNGEKVMEVWRKGKVVKRYKPLGIEYLYGRTKPTLLFGPLNSKGEVPGSDLAPVPKKYRQRCKHDQGWSIKEAVTKILEVNHWDDIDIILNQWVGRFNRRNFPPLMLAMTKTGALKHSVRLFTWMKAQRCYRARTDVYNLIIWLHARHYRVDAARALFKEMQEWRCKPDVETYNALINVHGRAGQWREALVFHDRMLRAAVPPSTGTYNNLISACGNSGHWKKALTLFEIMKNDGVYVDVVTHNTVLTALKIGEQYGLAIEHFEKALESKVVPDCITLNIIISCFSKMERYDEAVQLFNSMMSMKWQGCHPDLVTFTTVMHVYAVCGQVENVKAVFELMVREGVVPNVVSYNTLIGAYGSLGMDKEALEVFERMKKAGFEPDIVSYTALMNAYSKSGKPDEAASVFELLKRRSRKPNIVTYNTLIDAYSRAGRVREALELLPDMDYDEIPANVVTICSLVVGCTHSGEIDRVESILKVAALRNIRLNLNVYNTVLSVYLNNGMYKEGFKLYATMKEENIAPDLVTYAVLINGAAKVGNSALAQSLFSEMLSSGIGISVEACSALIHAYAEQGLPESAHAILTKMKEYGCKPNVLTYTSLIHAYDVGGMPVAAIALFEEMEAVGVRLDAVACSALFTVFNKCGHPDKTLALWSKWREHLQFDIAAFIQLSTASRMLADWKMALEIFDDMQLAGVKSNSTIRNNLLRSLREAGKSEQVHTLREFYLHEVLSDYSLA